MVILVRLLSSLAIARTGKKRQGIRPECPVSHGLNLRKTMRKR